MDLILWRHAQALEHPCDLTRALTPKGQQQAQAMAHVLQQHLPKDTVVWTSEATRSLETAAFLSTDTHIQAALNPDAGYQDIVPLLLSQHAQPLLVVGHQPWLGQVWEHCMTGGVADTGYWTIKKGGFVWLKLTIEPDGIEAKMVAALTSAWLNTP